MSVLAADEEAAIEITKKNFGKFEQFEILEVRELPEDALENFTAQNKEEIN